MWVGANHPDHRYFPATKLNEPVQRSRKRIAKRALELLHIVERWCEVQGFVGEATLKEQQLTGRVVGFRFDLIVAIMRQGKAIVAKHDVMVPRQQTMANFVTLVPSMLQLRLVFIEQDPALVW